MSYYQQLQTCIEEYRRKVHAGPVQVADIAAWLIREGRWAPSPQADIELASPQFMQQSIQQRRESIADDCWQLKQDLDSYNQYHNPAEPLQVLLDFTEDVEEREAARASSAAR